MEYASDVDTCDDVMTYAGAMLFILLFTGRGEGGGVGGDKKSMAVNAWLFSGTVLIMCVWVGVCTDTQTHTHPPQSFNCYLTVVSLEKRVTANP